ncbi:hypothetical protein [Piscibacillus halophilus]|uniref:Uncharacterized protein n=1 Tax=Piscibacillus halophilus TaxID=571933 RepID=A0A1H9J2P8_9BACI|nr:hypothetical protein [Piscibacillus halophilus]SEQ81124.1 hypothetical protein SAMN05216362_12825 [Piscibacillus halophilus]
MSDLSVKFKGFWEQVKDYTLEKAEAVKQTPRDVWVKNSPAIIYLISFLFYFFLVSKGSSLIWGTFFLTGLAYSIFVLHYWKKDHDFNMYLSLVVLLISLPLASFEILSFLFSSLYSAIM